MILLGVYGNEKQQDLMCNIFFSFYYSIKKFITIHQDYFKSTNFSAGKFYFWYSDPNKKIWTIFNIHDISK